MDPDTHHKLNFLTLLYFAVETIATVGYGDFSFGSQTQWMRVFAIAFIILGVTLVTMTYALVGRLTITPAAGLWHSGQPVDKELDDLVPVTHNPDVGMLEDRCIRVAVDRQHHTCALDSDHVVVLA